VPERRAFTMKFDDYDPPAFTLSVVNIGLFPDAHFRSKGLYGRAPNERVNGKGIITAEG
jgi:hypothetical protein